MSGQAVHSRNFLLHLQDREGFDAPILLKELSTDKSPRLLSDQLQNEYVITQKLSGVAGVRPIHAREGTESRPVLIMKYVEGWSLAELIIAGSLDLTEKLHLAVKVAEVLQRIHQHQVMHKDISSSNILVSSKDESGSQNDIYLIDFGIATVMQQERVTILATDDSLVGTLAFISPEQTGRINRNVDYRTDLYSLGVVLYELFANQLPFQSDDALKVIHDHIARIPPPPHDIESSVPGVLSEIILRLLAKNPEDRYQTARGLHTDLEHCLEQWQTKGRIEIFELGADDFTGRLRIPEKLYGRTAEIEYLQSILDRAATEQAQLFLVAGYSGVGKTALVREIQKDTIEKNGTYIEGKFDLLQRMQPYSAWSQAFTRLVNNWLAQSESSIAGWRDTILNAVGDHGQVLLDVVPVLERVLGTQPDVPHLGSVENQNRINHFFNRFIDCVATPEHPLVVFLDDLQWVDPASLNLIETLVKGQSKGRLLIIGAYRSNEVGVSHPLVVSQDRMLAETDQVTVLNLEDISIEAIYHLLADTLRLNATDCHDLGRVLVEKTAGNPFFFRQLLAALEADGLLWFHHDRRRWMWDDTLSQSLKVRGSVVDLMIEKVQSLPIDTQNVLSMAACIGSRFDVSILHIIIGQPKAEIFMALSPALQVGLINQSDGHFSFGHDRIQESGYALLPVSDRLKTHLRIGRSLLASVKNKDLEQEIFTIVGHLNVGRLLINNASEKSELAMLNLKAGQKAKTASAYSDAKKYVEIGIELLGTHSWQHQYDLTLSLYAEKAELAYLIGQFDEVTTTATVIHANARNNLDRVPIYMTQIEAATARSRFAEGLDLGLTALRDLGVEIPEQPSPQESLLLHEKFVGLLTNEPLERLDQLPRMSDERAMAASALLASVMSTAYIANPPLFPIISYQGGILTFQFGVDSWSPFFIGGIVLVNVASISPDTPADDGRSVIHFGRQLVEVIRALVDNPVTARGRTKGLFMLSFTAPWFETCKDAIELSLSTYHSRNETGDWLYGAYGASLFVGQSFAAGMNLPQYQRQVTAHNNTLRSVGQVMNPTSLAIHLQAADNFVTPSPAPHRLTGKHFDQDEWLSQPDAATDFANRHYLSVCGLILAYHLDCDEALDDCAAEAEKFLSGGPGLLSVAQFYFYQALGRLRQLGSESSTHQSDTMELITRNLQWMRLWSEAAPSTFQHKYDLMAAERARVLSDLEGAIKHYEQAISGARENGFTHEEALANELYARFWAERRNDRFAGPLMREADSLYRKWGALAKAEHIAECYPKWVVQHRALVPDIGMTSNGSVLRTADLDLRSILKASLEIAAELKLESLLAKLMNIVMENVGAQHGCLIQEQDGQWMVVAQAEMGGRDPEQMQSVNVETMETVSAGIAHYVGHTKVPLVLKDAANEGKFVDDPTIRKSQPKSILCAPLINQGRVSGIIYLENNLATGAFTDERVELINLLSSQMALALDNAQLYATITNSETRFRATFEQAAVGVAHVSLEGKFKRVNRKFCDIVGYSESEMLGLTFQDITHPDDLDVDLEFVRQMLDGELDTYSMDKRYSRKDGSIVWINLTVSLVLDEGGNPDYFVSIIIDISDRKSAEKALRQSHDFLQHLTSAVPDAIYSIKMPERTIEWANDSFGVMGYDDEEYIGHSTQEYYASPEEFQRIGLLQQEAIRKGEDFIRSEIMIVHKDGASFPAEITATFYREGGQISRITAMVRDITDRKQAVAQLTESERKYRSLVDNSMVGVFHSTIDGRYIFVNEAMAEMFDFDSPDQMISLGPHTLYKDKRERERLLAELHKYGTVKSFEAEAVSHANRHMHVIFSARLIGNDIFGMIMDITKRKEAEHKIFKSQQRLKALASQLTIVEEKERRIIAAGLHDHVGQSLALARIQLASASNITADPKILSKLNDISANLHEAINNTQTLMLELSSPTMHDMGLSSAISEWLENHVEKKYSIECKVIDNVTTGLRKSLDQDVRTILFRNVRELVVNVIKHSRATMVSIIFEDRGPNLRIIVADNGIGFSHKTTIQAGSETGGFGLFSIEELMIDLGGSLKILSDPGDGCTAILSAPFSVYHERERG